MVPSVLYASLLLLLLTLRARGTAGAAPRASGPACAAREEEDSTSALQFPRSQASGVELRQELGAACPGGASCPDEKDCVRNAVCPCAGDACDPPADLWKGVDAGESGTTCKVVCDEAGASCGGFNEDKRWLCVDHVPEGTCIHGICAKSGSQCKGAHCIFKHPVRGPKVCVNPCPFGTAQDVSHFTVSYGPCDKASKPDCKPKLDYCKRICSALGQGWICKYLCSFRWSGVKLAMEEHCDTCCKDGACDGLAALPRAACHGSAASLAEGSRSEGGAAAEADLALLEGLGEPGADGSSEASQQVLDYLLDARSELAEEQVRKEVLEALEGVEASWCGDWSRWCTPLCKAVSWPSKAAVSKCEEYCSEAAPDLAPVFHTYCKAGVCKSKGWPWASGTEEDVVASAAASP